MFLQQWRDALAPGMGAPCVVSRSQFEGNFARLCAGGSSSSQQSLLAGLNWSNVVVAGGAVLACLLQGSDLESHFANSDVCFDFFKKKKKKKKSCFFFFFFTTFSSLYIFLQ